MKKTILLAVVIAWTLVPALALADGGYPPLPKGITSFGGAVLDSWLYLYGGHFGRAHHYDNASQSDQLSRLNLHNPTEWEVVATGPRLQGLAMVAHEGMLYRLGGFTAHNDPNEGHDLRSVADVARFDPKTKVWEALTPLPEPRSSFDAVVIGDRLYVVGGWQLMGGEEEQWHETAWVADLTQDPLVWQALPTPPFQRRALSLGHLDGRLYAIGGMQEEGGATTRVDALDLATGQWSQQASLIDSHAKSPRQRGMEGFGTSAWGMEGKLWVSTYAGSLQCLDPDADFWKVVTQLKEDRFFHRMLPFEGSLILVGGASMRAGKRLELETVALSALK